MNTPQLANFTKLIKQKKFDDAKILLSQDFRKPWSKEKKGEILTHIADAYMGSQDTVNKNSVEFLDDTVSLLEKIAKKEIKAQDAGKMDEIRKKIKEL